LTMRFCTALDSVYALCVGERERERGRESDVYIM